MKLLTILIILTISFPDLFSQNDSVLKFIFVPHPRSEDQVHQSVYPGIAKIDFTKYDVKMIGGDITYDTGKDSATLSYCDNLFDLGSPNTLWCFGNHDVQSGHRTLIKKFTGRDSYYSYSRDGVTFIVLDTELDANAFSSTFIKGDQLQMVKNVCDTIAESRYLILLHHRFMWMINSDYFKSRLTDSIAASSRSMDTTNFYSDIYPLLQKVKSKGIQVLVFGGDKTKINFAYSPEDSITFYAARLAADLPDSINNVIILEYNLQEKEITCNFTPLAEIITSIVQEFHQLPEGFVLNQNYPNPFNPSTRIKFSLPERSDVRIEIFNINGQLIKTLTNKSYEQGTYETDWDGKDSNGKDAASGIYIYKMIAGGFIQAKKMLLVR